MSVKVSVVMPVYNGELTVDASIRSILEQSFGDFELIVIDDGSTDSTPSLLRAHMTDGRLRIITQANAGVVAALNVGLEAAVGEYVARADADDLYHVDRLKYQVAFLDSHDGVMMVCSNYIKMFPDGLREATNFPSEHGPIMDMLFNGNWIMHASVMFRTEPVRRMGSYSSDWKHIEDWEMWFRIGANGHLHCLPEHLSFLRVHDESVSAKNEIFQARMGIRLRWRMIADRRFPAIRCLSLFRPLLKVAAGQTLVTYYRRIFGLRRYR